MAEEKTVFVLLPGKKEAGDRYQLLQEDVALATGTELGLHVEVGLRARLRPAPRAEAPPRRRARRGRRRARERADDGFILRELRGRRPASCC